MTLLTRRLYSQRATPASIRSSFSTSGDMTFLPTLELLPHRASGLAIDSASSSVSDNASSKRSSSMCSLDNLRLALMTVTMMSTLAMTPVALGSALLRLRMAVAVLDGLCSSQYFGLRPRPDQSSCVPHVAQIGVTMTSEAGTRSMGSLLIHYLHFRFGFWFGFRFRLPVLLLQVLQVLFQVVLQVVVYALVQTFFPLCMGGDEELQCFDACHQ